LEWFFPKVFETLNHAPQVYRAADIWLEAGDWFVWQLVDGPFPHCNPQHLTRSTCQAGYKACWNKQTGYPSRDFFATVHPKLADVVAEKLPGVVLVWDSSCGNHAPRDGARMSRSSRDAQWRNGADNDELRRWPNRDDP